MLPSLYLKIAAGLIVVALIGGAGYKVGASRWETKYDKLQAADYQGLAQREATARKALEGQLAQARAISTNNAKVIDELHNQNAAITADRDHTNDLVRRLLARTARPAPGLAVPKDKFEPGPAAAGPSGSDEQVAGLLADAADECRRNAAQLNALIAQLKPQL